MPSTSVREKLKDTRVGAAVALGLLALALAIGLVYYLHNRTPTTDPFTTFYTDDDGQSYFRDSIYKLPPFDHGGKPAYLAVVCTDGKQNFVGLLERFTPDAKKKLQDVYDANPDAHYRVIDMMASPQIVFSGMEVKLPGSGHQWTLRGRGMPRIQAPDGSYDTFVIVHP